MARLGAARAERDLIDARAALSARVVETLQVASELRMWQQIQHAADTVAATSDRIGRDGRAAATWSGAARALVLATTGVGRGRDGGRGIGGPVPGELSGPMLALLVLMPLALAEVAAPLTEAGALSVRTRAAGAQTGPPGAHATRGPGHGRDRSPTSSAIELSDVRARWDVDAPLTAPVSFDLGPGERVALVGLPDPARAPSPHCSCASSTPNAAG